MDPLKNMTKAHWRTLLSLLSAAGDSANEESHLERSQGTANVAGLFADDTTATQLAESSSLIRQHLQSLP